MLRLLLVSPTRTFLCLVFDPLCNRLYIVGANTEELAIVNLIAEQEGIEPRPQKKWDKFLGEFGSVAFVVAPLYSTFLRQKDGVSCHSACLVMLHSIAACNFHMIDCGFCVRLHKQLCTIAILCMLPLSRPHRVGPWHECMLGPIVHLAVRHAFFFMMMQSTSRALNVEFISVPCMLLFCVHRRYVWHCASGECNLLPHLHALYWHSHWVTGAVDKLPLVDEVLPKVVIRGTEFFVLEHYPKDASGRLQYDKKLIEELDMKTTDVLRNMCKHNPPSAQPTYKDKKADLIYKRVFCDFI